MDRRESLKSLLIGAAAAGTAITTGSGCKPGEEEIVEAAPKGYGIRMDVEERQDRLVYSETFLSEGELAALVLLADVICPADASGPAASETGIKEFFDFNIKDMPDTQQPMRGGLAFVQQLSRDRFEGKTLAELEPAQLNTIMEDLSFPDKKEDSPELAPGIDFMSSLRYMTLSGYYSSRPGVKALGYQGNIPNQWDGVPAEVLAKHDVDYEADWIAKCIDHEKSQDVAEWDDDGNLIT